jgi:hypothetical protein
MQGQTGFAGTLTARRIPPRSVGFGYKLRNFPNLWRGLWRYWLARIAGIPTLYGTLYARLFRADGEIIDYGQIGARSITTAWVTAMATYQFDASGTAPTAYDYHASGTGVVAENITDTAMGTDSGIARTNGTPTNPSAGVYRTVGTMAYTGPLAITEHGIFSAATVGTLMDRTVFAAINVVNGDSIQFTYNLTWTAGG